MGGMASNNASKRGECSLRKFQQHDAFEALGFMFTMLNFADGFAFDYIVGQKENVVCPNCGVVMERQCENDDGDGFLEIPIEKYMQANDVQALIDAYQTEQEKEVNAMDVMPLQIQERKMKSIKLDNF